MEHVIDINDIRHAWQDSDDVLHAACSCGAYFVGFTPEQVARAFFDRRESYRNKEGD